MPEEIFSQFAARLERALGTPAGRTDATVQKELRFKYLTIFDAISQFSGLLSYQDAALKINVVPLKTDRLNQIVHYKLAIPTTDGLTFRLEHGQIFSDNPYILHVSHNKMTWTRDEQAEFREVLSDALLKMLGA